MTTPRLHLLAPFIAVACSSQLAELERSQDARPARTAIHVDSDTLSSLADNDAGSATCTACDGDGAEPPIPSTPHRGPETRTPLRVGIRQSVSLSIEFAPPPPPAPSVDCSPLTLTLVGKRTAAVGERLPLQAFAGELEGAELRYEWSGPAELQVTGADSAAFVCETPGEYAVVLRLASPEACSTELPFTIHCGATE